MKITIAALAAVALAAMFATGAGAQEKVRIAVGGKSAVFYLPLSVAERLGCFQGRRPRRRDFRRRERRPHLAVDRRRQRRDRHRHLRPRHPDAGQEPAGGGAAAIRPLSGLRAGDDGRQGRSLQIAEGPEGPEDRRDLARLQHAFHGGLHDGAHRAEGRRRLVRRHRHHLDRGRGGAPRRDRRHRQLRSDDDDDGKREAGEGRRRHAHRGRHQGRVWRAVSRRRDLRHAGHYREKSASRAEGGQRLRATA